MKRAKMIKITIYLSISIVAIVLLSGGYIWYTMQKTMNAMYEPLPSTEWVKPVFEAEPDESATLPPVSAERQSSVETDYQVAAIAAAAQEQPKPVEIMNEEELMQLRQPSLSDQDPFCILLLGVDQREGDQGRSDTMILLAVQPAKQSVMALSIPRDTRAVMPNSGASDKINHAYAFGGISNSVTAVERLFGVPIAYYMKTNMEGWVDIVDTLGGLDVDNPWEFESDGYAFPAGLQHLEGKGALAYIRMRRQDPQGDFGRTQRQRLILSSAVDRITSVKSISKLPRLLSQLSKDVRTNLTSGNLLDLAMHYRPAIQNVDTLHLQGSGKIIKGIYYYIVQPEERQEVQEKLLKHLKAT